jgi:hypothetical protein
MNGHQQNGPVPHFSRQAIDVRSAVFRGIWIGKACSFLWPPRRADFTPFDFLFVGCVKNCVCIVMSHDKIQDPNHFRARIRREAAEQVTVEMLQHVWQEVEC